VLKTYDFTGILSSIFLDKDLQRITFQAKRWKDDGKRQKRRQSRRAKVRKGFPDVILINNQFYFFLCEKID